MIIEAYKSVNVVNGFVTYSDNNRLDTNNVLRFLLMEDRFLNLKKRNRKDKSRVKEYL